MISEGDIILICFEEKPSLYARIEAITSDMRKGWFHVLLLFLTLPEPSLVTWVLRDSYINGETFTMGGKTIRLKKVEKMEADLKDIVSTPENAKKSKSAQIIPFKKK